MDDVRRLACLRIVLVIVGLIALFGLYPLMLFWPAGWAWETGHLSHDSHAGLSEYALMIVGIYATLGVFLLIASRDPLRHLSLIWFTVWSSIVHAAIMAVQSFGGDGHREHLGHLLGDVPALFIVAAALAAFMPRGGKSHRLNSDSRDARPK
ncbi:DUF6632 domain-containing protein [Caballeronia insecticola]|uniref:Transmembrane protein n=1 Tax=Caballeronia insecticola TaxID=758793 RepID=R4X335_9BURK|nr:DUF6632 domain-containing protein [Caballeronia insecticola]BAN27096.1 putative uncharacterized protein [Caballeronia insecticola]